MRIHFVASTAFVLLTSTAALASENDAYILQVGNRDTVHQTQEGSGDDAVAIQAGEQEPGDAEPARRLGRQHGGLAPDRQAEHRQADPGRRRRRRRYLPSGRPFRPGQDPLHLRHRQRLVGGGRRPGRRRSTWRRRPRSAPTTSPPRSRSARTTTSSRPRARSARRSPVYSTSPAGRGTIRSDDPISSFGSFAGVLQVGDLHGAIQKQSGIGHTALALQVGSDDGSYQTQTGFGQEALSIQFGAANRSTQTQSGLANDRHRRPGRRRQLRRPDAEVSHSRPRTSLPPPLSSRTRAQKPHHAHLDHPRRRRRHPAVPLLSRHGGRGRHPPGRHRKSGWRGALR